MRVINDLEEMRRFSTERKRQGRKVGFVPTMGYLHEGHLALMRRGRKECDDLIISIFVNPTQFGPSEDFTTYPRDFERDSGLAESVGVDVIFAPTPDQIYPPGFQTYVTVTDVTKDLEGVSRPGHFRGVATVVLKLFLIVKPHFAYFGEKDYQQLITIKRMTSDLFVDVVVVGCPTVREEDGLAMSSRNVYLSPEGRLAARCLSRALATAQKMADDGETDAHRIIGTAREIIERESLTQIDYLTIRDPETLEEVQFLNAPARMLMVVKIENTRLLDNGLLHGKEAAR